MSRKTLSLKGRSKTDKKISLFAMVSIALLAIFNFQNVVDNYVGLGLSASFAFAIAVIVFLFPFIFIIAEFASLLKGSKSGLTSWIKTAVGRKTAFLTSFMFWFANLTFFFSAVPARLNFLTFAVTGTDYTSDSTYNAILPWACIIFFFIITLISTLNTKRIAWITSLGGGLMLGVTCFFFLMALIGWTVGAVDPTLLPVQTEAPGLHDINLWGDTNGLIFPWISTFIWVLMAADGAQTLGVYVNDVKGGKKAFVRAMLISVSLIGIFYVVGTVLVSIFPPSGGLANGWANSFSNLFQFMFQSTGMTVAQIQKFTNILIGLIFFISTFGGLLIWTAAPVKVMFSEIEKGIFGQKLSKENRYGVCSFGAWIQFILVSILLLPLMLIGGDLGEVLSIIKSSAGWIGLLPWLVIFVAYVNLRIRKDNEPRSFRMGNRAVGATIGIILSIITIAILILSFLDTAPLDKPYDTWASNWWLGPVLKVVMMALILIPAYLWYYFKFEYQIRGVKICQELGITTECVLDQYNFSKKNKFAFIYNNIFQEFAKKDDDIVMEYKSMINNEWKQVHKLQAQINKQVDKLSILDKLTKNLSGQEKKDKIKAIKTEVKVFSKANNVEIKKHKTIAKALLKEMKAAQKANKVALWESLRAKYEADKVRFESEKQQIKNYASNLKANNKEAYNQLLLKDVETTMKRDIDWNNVKLLKHIEKGEKVYVETPIIYQYSSISKKRAWTDKLVITNKRMFIINDHADDLVTKEYDVKNMRFVNQSKTKSIDVVGNGQWNTFDKVQFIYNDNTQIETFNVYIPTKTKMKNKYFVKNA